MPESGDMNGQQMSGSLHQQSTPFVQDEGSPLQSGRKGNPQLNLPFSRPWFGRREPDLAINGKETLKTSKTPLGHHNPLNHFMNAKFNAIVPEEQIVRS